MPYTAYQLEQQQEQERKLRIARMVADRVTDEMLTTPVKDLSPAEVAILHAAFSGPFGDELTERIDQLHAQRT